MSSGGVGSKGTPRQLVLLLSDGRFDRENKDRLRKLVREMNERGQLLVLIGTCVTFGVSCLRMCPMTCHKLYM